MQYKKDTWETFRMGKIGDSIKKLANEMAFISAPKSCLEDYDNLKDLLEGKKITVDDLHREYASSAGILVNP